MSESVGSTYGKDVVTVAVFLAHIRAYKAELGVHAPRVIDEIPGTEIERAGKHGFGLIWLLVPFRMVSVIVAVPRLPDVAVCHSALVVVSLFLHTAYIPYSRNIDFRRLEIAQGIGHYPEAETESGV